MSIDIKVSKIDDDNFIGTVKVFGKRLTTFSYATDYIQALNECVNIVKEYLVNKK